MNREEAKAVLVRELRNMFVPEYQDEAERFLEAPTGYHVGEAAIRLLMRVR